MSESRSVRIFISSTFRDFSGERDLLVRQVFPALRARLQQRFVELVDVDLRWGITADQAERGEVLPICLAEIDRSRPYFVGLLGERYGWTPSADAYPAALLERESWLYPHRGDKSVTELEILHGVLNNPAMAGRALFYFRAPSYARAHGGDYLSSGPTEHQRQEALKALIRASAFPLVEDYPDPSALAERLGEDLWAILDATFPPEEVPDSFMRASRQHQAYAAPRRRLYLGGRIHLDALDEAMATSEPRILIEGASGGGKSALLANWLSQWRAAHPHDLIYEHYLAATSDAAEPASLVRRLIETIRRATRTDDPIPSEPQKLFESLPAWLAAASAYASHLGCRWIIALDGLNGLTDLRDLRWLPSFLPVRVHLVVSCLPGSVLDALEGKGPWQRIDVKPLAAVDAEHLLTSYLARYNKTLSSQQVRLALSHPLSTNPLFLRTLAEELRVFGVYEQLSARIRHYLRSETVAELFERVLERVEQDCGEDRVRKAMVAIWASRSGLNDKEIEGIAELVPATWAPIRYAMAEALLETDGRLTFAHDYLRQAAAARYLPGAEAKNQAHRGLAIWFAGRPVDARVAEELPWQWHRAEAWVQLEQCLLTRSVFEAIHALRQDSVELYGYWLDLERHAALRIEHSYAIAWSRWKLDENIEPDRSSDQRRLAWAKLAVDLSALLRFAGRYAEPATALIRQAIDIREAVLGAEHLDTAEALADYAGLLSVKGDELSALPYRRNVLAVREKLQGAEHADTIESLRNLGASLRVLGQYEEAEKILRRAVELKEKNPGDTPDGGQLLNSLAVLISARGDSQTAEALMRRALDAAKRVKGPDSPGTLAILRNIGVAAEDRGDLSVAETNFRHVLEVQQRILGENHPETLNSLGRLAALLGKMGEYEQSEALFWQVLHDREKVLGPDHPAIASTLNNFAAMLYERGHYAAGVQLLRRSLKIEQGAHGAEHPNTLSVMANLAIMLGRTGEETAAEIEQIERHVLAIRQRVLGPEHPDTANIMASLAGTLENKGDVDGAIALLQRAAAIEEKVLGPEHPKLARTLENLAGILRDNGELDAALALQRRVLAINESTLGPHSPSTAVSLEEVASTLRKMKDPAAAEGLLQRALPIKIMVDGAESDRVVLLLEEIANTQSEQGHHDQAEETRRRVLDIVVRTKGADHIEVAMALLKLGEVLVDKQDFANLEAPARRALEIIEASKGPEHGDTINALHYLGFALRFKGDIPGAVEIQRRVLRSVKKFFGEAHLQTAMAHASLADRLKQAGDLKEAEHHYRRAEEIHCDIGESREPSVGQIDVKLGELCLGQERYAEAEQWFRRAMQTDMDKAETANTAMNLGKTVLFLGIHGNEPDRIQEAVALLRHALALYPRNGNENKWGTTQLWLGIALNSLAKFGNRREHSEQAMEALAAALEIWPADAKLQAYFDEAKAAHEAG